MMAKYRALFLALLMTTFSCREHPASKESQGLPTQAVKGRIQQLNQSLTEAAKDQDFSRVADLYTDDAILLAAYNPLIDGKRDIETYYTEVFHRQKLTAYQKETEELFDFGNTLLEIGSFKKEFDTEPSLEGKYMNVWKRTATGDLGLKSESFGYYHPVDTPEKLRVFSLKDKTPGLQAREGKTVPLELDVYDALNENCVRDRDTKKLIESYTEDAVYYPFADTRKAGIEALRTHFTEYHRNPVKIDSIQIWTYDYEPVGDGIIQYAKFYVQWTVPGFTGSTQGTGQIYFKRQADHSLKIFRQIGLHIHVE